MMPKHIFTAPIDGGAGQFSRVVHNQSMSLSQTRHKLVRSFNRVADPLWRWGRSMTQEFLDGILVAMMPSMFIVAWLVWRASPIDSDF
jgi:hypothetical protein